jgi:hypothetical protein
MAVITLALTVVTSIDPITPAGTTGATATVISRLCNSTVVYATPTADMQGIMLPSAAGAAAVGDTVEVHLNPVNATGVWTLLIYPASGETILNSSPTAGVPVPLMIGTGAATVFRRLASTIWGMIGI